MRKLVVLLAVCCFVGAAQGAADDLLFVRGGRVYLLRAGATKSEAVIAPDRGYVYALPTWLDPEHFMVLRLKGGKVAESEVGLVELVEKLPVALPDIVWLEEAKGAWSIGACPQRGLMAYTRFTQAGLDDFQMTLHVSPLDGEFESQVVKSFEQAPTAPAEARLRFSQDGRYVTVPEFPTEPAESTCALFDRQKAQAAKPIWLNWEWLNGRNGPSMISAAAFFLEDLVAVGGSYQGLYLCNTKQKKIIDVDAWEMGTRALIEVAVSADDGTVYYEVRPEEGANREHEIRAYDVPAGETKVILRNATAPDPKPAAG